MGDFDQIGKDEMDNDSPIGKMFDEFCECWWENKERTMMPRNSDGQSHYSTNEEWKLLEWAKKNETKDANETIGEYELMITNE
ncbi:hypothetical protein Tco_0484380 [Tanacetum coccineum]